jgi:hypothetical protein
MLGTCRLGSDNDVNGLRVIFTNSDLVEFYPLYYFPTKISPDVKIARRRADTFKFFKVRTHEILTSPLVSLFQLGPVSANNYAISCKHRPSAKSDTHT